MGSVWECLIKPVKTALNAILIEQVPREETSLTVLVEIEHIVNSRPLTRLSMDPQDVEVLTPNHFLIGTSSAKIQFKNCNSLPI